MFENVSLLIIFIGFCLTMYGIYYAYNPKNRWSVFIPFFLGLTLMFLGGIKDALNRREIKSRVEHTSDYVIDNN